MFDALRRAEAERRKRTSNDEPKAKATVQAPPERVTPIEARTAPMPPSPAPSEAHVAREARETRPSVNGGGPLPGEFLRELGILRNSIETVLGKRGKRTVLFTSPVHEAGTTTLSTSYAQLLAMHSSERILVVEMNARRPSMMWRFALPGKEGVTEYLSGGRELKSLVQSPASRGFDILAVGEPDATKIQLHLESGFPRLIDEALRSYDIVIIDAPPVVLSPETPPMCSSVDGVALIVESGRTKREIAQRALEMIGQFEGRVLGVVLNRKKYYIPDFIYRRL